MPLHHGDPSQEALFKKLKKIAERTSLELNCFISGSGDQFFVSMTDQKTKEDRWVRAGKTDLIISEFERWITNYDPLP